MFIVALFIITKDLNRPKCPSTVDYYKTMKKSALLLHAATWMNLTDIMLSERRQAQNNTTIIPFI